MSNNIIHGIHSLYVLLTIVFNTMLIHCVCPDSMILGTTVPIPKNKKKSLCNSDNYRVIALSSIIGKIGDWVILIKEYHVLKSFNIQFGLKNNLSGHNLINNIYEKTIVWGEIRTEKWII